MLSAHHVTYIHTLLKITNILLNEDNFTKTVIPPTCIWYSLLMEYAVTVHLCITGIPHPMCIWSILCDNINLPGDLDL